MANSNLRLIYFDMPGLGEIIRLILTWADKEFEDVRISGEKWPEVKPTTPFGQLPLIEIDGKVYAQSLAIANYCAREFGLYGKSNEDGLKIDQFAQLTQDFIKEVIKCVGESDEAKKAEIEKKIKKEDASRYLGFTEKLLDENNGEHLVGDSFTLADLIAYDVATGSLKVYIDDVYDRYPLLKQLVEKVGNNEKIKAYRESHK